MHSDKHKINLISENLEIPAAEGQTVLEALIGAGIFLRTDCGGKGGCGKCRVKIAAGTAGDAAAPDESEIKILGQSDLSEGVRLACRLIISGDISLEIPETSRLSAEVAQKGLPTLFDKLADLKTPKSVCMGLETFVHIPG